VGVFAVKPIEKNINPFKVTRTRKEKVIQLSESDIKNVHPNIKKMLKDFCKTDNTYDVPFYGLNSIDITFFLNHSKTPNLDVVYDPSSEYLDFRTNRHIKIGEELFIDYRVYNTDI